MSPDNHNIISFIVDTWLWIKNWDLVSPQPCRVDQIYSQKINEIHFSALTASSNKLYHSNLVNGYLSKVSFLRTYIRNLVILYARLEVTRVNHSRFEISNGNWVIYSLGIMTHSAVWEMTLENTNWNCFMHIHFVLESICPYPYINVDI